MDWKDIYLGELNDANEDVEWITEWPKEEGVYWFYGYCFRDRNRPPELHYVEINKISNGWMIVTNGHFMYKSEGGFGLWKKANLPELPKFPKEV